MLDINSLKSRRGLYLSDRVNNVERQFDVPTWLIPELFKLYGDGVGILLFGSYVNGFPDKDSDYDILIFDPKLNAGVHECRYILEERCDIHVLGYDYLIKEIASECKHHMCFYVKSISESVLLRENTILQKTRSVVRRIYTNPPPFNEWSRMKINLLSKLDDFRKKRSCLQDNMYYSELADLVIKYLCLATVGWMSRLDVMVEWLQHTAPQELNYASEKYNDALYGRPLGLHALCNEVLDAICDSPKAGDDFSVSQDGRVKLIG